MKIYLMMFVLLASWQTAAEVKAQASSQLAVPSRAQRLRQAREIVDMQRKISVEQLTELRYWDAGPPSYRWNQIIMTLVRSEQSGVRPERGLALINIAMHDAVAAAERMRKESRAANPKSLDTRISELVTRPPRYSWPSEHAAAAGAAQEILRYLMPSQTAYFDEKAASAGRSRIIGGGALASDVDAGFEIGRKAGREVVRWAQQDGSNVRWTGSIPAKPGTWTGKDPQDPQLAKWKPIVLERPDQLRPPPPPAYDEEAMKDLTAPTSKGMKAAAYKWIGFPIWQYWNEVLARKILEDRMDQEPERAALAYAALNVAMYDSLIASSDAKYEYWTMRPVQVDPKFKPLLSTPNSPSYPSSTAMLSAAAATVLESLFPADEAVFWAQAEEAAASVWWAGIHFKIDSETGFRLGKQIGELTLQKFRAQILQENEAPGHEAHAGAAAKD